MFCDLVLCAEGGPITSLLNETEDEFPAEDGAMGLVEGGGGGGLVEGRVGGGRKGRFFWCTSGSFFIRREETSSSGNTCIEGILL